MPVEFNADTFEWLFLKSANVLHKEAGRVQSNASDELPRLRSVETAEAKNAPQHATGNARVVYPVADLIVPIRGLDGNDRTNTKEDWLIKKIKCSVSPQTWDDQGGAGSIQYLPKEQTLVVNNSPPIRLK